MKYVGILCIFAAIALSGRINADCLKQRVETLKDFKVLINLIKTEIDYVNAPIVEIMKAISNKNEITNLNFIKSCISHLDSGESFPAAWDKAIKGCSFNELTKSDIEIIRSFGQSLGTTFSSGQLKLCSMYIEMIENNLESAEKVCGKEYGMRSKLGIVIGLTVAVILI